MLEIGATRGLLGSNLSNQCVPPVANCEYGNGFVGYDNGFAMRRPPAFASRWLAVCVRVRGVARRAAACYGWLVLFVG